MTMLCRSGDGFQIADEEVTEAADNTSVSSSGKHLHVCSAFDRRCSLAKAFDAGQDRQLDADTQVTLTLSGRTWDDIGVVLLWCVVAALRMRLESACHLVDLRCLHPVSDRESSDSRCRRCKSFDANFGQVELQAAQPAANAAAAALPVVQRPRPPPGPPSLENCAPLTGRYRVHWQVQTL